MRSMTTAWIALVLFASSPVALAGGKEAGNGGGISEQLLLIAYDSLLKPMQYFVAFHDPGIAPSDVEMVRELIASYPTERLNPKPIVFMSGLENPDESPGFFFIDGEVRVGRTGNNVGDPIYINTDLLYTYENGTFITFPITYPLAVSILVHEMIHHHGVHDQTTLDRIGSEVADVETHPTTETRTSVENLQYLDASYVNYYTGTEMFHRLMIATRTEVMTIDDVLAGDKSLNPCKAGYALLYSYVTNLSWSNQDQTVKGADGPEPLYRLLAQVHVTCDSASGDDYQQDVMLALSLPLDFEENPGYPTRRVLDCQHDPASCW